MIEDAFAAVRRAKQRFQDLALKDLALQDAGVVGIGIGLKGTVPALKVNLRSDPPQPNRLPAEIEGVPIMYEVVGAIRSRSVL